MTKKIAKKFIRLIGKFQNFQKEMRQSELDAYISVRNPKHTGDVERMMREFEARSRLGF